MLEYHQANLPAIQKLIADSVAFQTANEGPIVFRGSYPWPPFPPLPSAPDVDAPQPDMILDDPPCGYYLTEQQYAGAQPDGTVKLRLQLHGITVVPAPVAGRGPGYIVLMEQPLRGLIPLLLDGQAAEPMVDGARLYPATTSRGEPLPDAACGRGRVVDTSGMNVEYQLDYETS